MKRQPDVRHVYFAQDDATGLVKIGVSADPVARIARLASICDTTVATLGFMHFAGGAGERELHRRFDYLRFPGTHLRTSEWFRPAEDLLAFIEANTTDEQPPTVDLGPIRVPSFLEPVDAAYMLHVSVGDLDDCVARGLPRIRIGNTVRYPLDAVREWAQDKAA